MKSAIDIIKDINNRKSLSKTNSIYADKLKGDLYNDIDNQERKLLNHNERIKTLLKSRSGTIEDKFLIIKVEEHLENTKRLIKKIDRTLNKRMTTTKDIYEYYSVFVQAVETHNISLQYINQLSRYTCK